MTHVRFNHRNCMPARSEYPASHNTMNWFWNDFANGYNERTVPLANIAETANDFRIELEVPGFSKSEFKLNLEEQVLSISGESSALPRNEEENYVRHEFSRTAFSRNFRLSNRVDSGSIHAKYENGILLVTIPKLEETKAKPAREIGID